MADKTPKEEAEDILAKHGPRGRFVKVLYRFRMAGWVLFFVLLGVFLMDYIIRAAMGPKILVMNTDGQIVGNIDFYNDLQRTREQYTHAGAAFLNYWLPVNSGTVLRDFYAALAMMAPPLRERKQQERLTAFDEETNKPFLLAVEQKKIRSWLEFDQGEKAPRIVGTKGDTVLARYTGTLVAVGTQRVEKRFDVTVAMKPAVRHHQNFFGIEVEDFNDN